jgi:hypothetical protein
MNKMRWIDFPDTLKGTVTAIPGDAFNGWTNLCGTVRIPNRIVSINGNAAFYNTRIDSLFFPEGFVYIYNQQAFDNCTNLKYVYFPPSLSYIGSYAFRNCTQLRSIDTRNVQTINDYAFAGCTGLTGSLHLEKVTVLNRAFDGCTGFTDTLYFPRTLNTWGTGSFYNMNKMRWIDFPDTLKGTVTAIPGEAFMYWNSLRGTVRIPKGIRTIYGNAAFYQAGMDSLFFPEGFVSINNQQAFDGCNRLRYVYFPQSLNYIGSYSFRNCTGLRSIDTRNVQTINDYAFGGCTGLTGSLHLENVTVLNRAFDGCTGFTDTLFFPRTLTTWGTGSFHNMNKMRWIDFPDTLKGTVTAIPGEAFMYWSSLRGTVRIPKGIKTIYGNYAFYQAGMDSLFFPKGFVSINNQQAFDGCSRLRHIYFPSSVTTIGSYSFRNCTSLKSIVADMATPPALTAQSVIENVPRTAVLTVPSGSVCDYVAAAGWKEFLLAPGLVCCSAPAAANGSGAGYTWDYDCGVLTLGGTDVPDFANAAAQPWAGFRTNIQTVVVGAGIARVGNNVFASCTALDSVSLPASLTALGTNTFQSCINLRVVDLSGSPVPPAAVAASFASTLVRNVTLRVPDAAACDYVRHTFWGDFKFTSAAACACTPRGTPIVGSLLSWTFNTCGNKTLTISGTGAMPNYSNGGAPWYALREDIQKIVLSPGVTSVGNSAFYNLPNLDSVKFAATLEVIGNEAFRECGIKTFHLPQHITSLGQLAFYACRNLTAVSFASTGLTALGGREFEECTALRGTVALPATLSYVSSRMFYNCYNLQEISLGSGITAIRENAFMNCTKLTSPTFPAGLVAIGNDAFNSCRAISTVNFTGTATTTIGARAFAYCSALTSLTLTGVVTIGQEAFRDCGIGTLSIPASVTSLGLLSFYNCRNLANLSFAAGSPQLTALGGREFEECTALSGTVILPSSLTYISSRMFYNCNQLERIVLPAGITSIQNAAFYNCLNLASPNFTTAAGLVSIGNDAFNNCRAISAVDFTATTTTTLGARAFAYCFALTSLHLGQVVTVGAEAFRECGLTGTLDIPGSVSELGTSSFQACRSLTGINFAATGLTTTGTHVFYGCSELRGTVRLPSTLQNVGARMFQECVKLEEVVCAAGVTAIGYAAFYNCRSLSAVTLPVGLYVMDDYAFALCHSLQNITLPAGLNRIGAYAFAESGLSGALVLNSGLKQLGTYAFNTCRGLTSVVIPDGLTIFGNYAFNNCTGLS